MSNAKDLAEAINRQVWHRAPFGILDIPKMQAAAIAAQRLKVAALRREAIAASDAVMALSESYELAEDRYRQAIILHDNEALALSRMEQEMKAALNPSEEGAIP